MKNPIKRARKIQRKTRRKNGLHNSKSNSVSINYCPCCGFDMHGLAVAIVMSSELK